jgi:hypothetical protein
LKFEIQVGSWKLEIGNLKFLDVGSWKLEVGGLHLLLYIRHVKIVLKLGGGYNLFYFSYVRGLRFILEHTYRDCYYIYGHDKGLSEKKFNDQEAGADDWEKNTLEKRKLKEERVV